MRVLSEIIESGCRGQNYEARSQSVRAIREENVWVLAGETNPHRRGLSSDRKPWRISEVGVRANCCTVQWIGLNIIMRKNETCRAARYSLLRSAFIPRSVIPLLSTPLFRPFPRSSTLFLYATNPYRLVLRKLTLWNRSLESLAPSQRCRHRLHRKECIFHILTILPLSVALIGLEGRNGRKKKIIAHDKK